LGVRQTVTRVRTALGGGNPNDLLPALRAWREGPKASAFAQSNEPIAVGVPMQVTDLCVELSRTRELPCQLDRELLNFGTLRAWAARHEAVARNSATRLEQSEIRGRKALRDLGEARARIAELEATMAQLKARPPPARVVRRRPAAQGPWPKR